MMGAITIGAVLRAEHDIIGAAFSEWIGRDRNTTMEDLQYLWGVHDLSEKLIQRMEAEESE